MLKNNIEIFLLSILIFTVNLISCLGIKSESNKVNTVSSNRIPEKDIKANTSGIEETESSGENACKTPYSPDKTPLLRLTGYEYINTVKEILGTGLNLERFIPMAEDRDIGSSLGHPSQVEIFQYQSAAESIALHIKQNINKFAFCEDQSSTDAALICLNKFLDEYGILIFRSPLTIEDKNDLTPVFIEGLKTSYEKGIELVSKAMFQSPRFLYRIEVGDSSKSDGNAVPLNSYEYASRISFAIWNQGPDKLLLQEAALGSLITSSGRQVVINRMLKDERAKRAFSRFFYKWFGLKDYVDKDRTMFPKWNDAILLDMKKQAEKYIENIVVDPTFSFESLFLSDHKQYASQNLQAWYTNPEGSKGILSLPLFLSSHSKADETFPVERGVFMLEDIFCIHLPDPPEDIGDPPMISDTMTTRERFEEHSSNPSCKNCHQLIDPLGFAFEQYDATGMFRTMENGKKIDVSGTVIGTDVDGPFQGIGEVSVKVSKSSDARSCATKHWFRYIMQRRETLADECSLTTMKSKFAAANYSFKDLRLSLFDTQAFTHRSSISVSEETDTMDTTDTTSTEVESSEPPVEENRGLIRNSSFDDGSDYWVMKGSGIISVDGNKVFRPLASSLIRQTISLESNRDYTLTSRIYVLPGSSGPAVVDTFDRFDDTAQTVINSATDGWINVTKTFNSGSFDSVTIRAFIEKKFTGTVYFDDIQLIKN